MDFFKNKKRSVIFAVDDEKHTKQAFNHFAQKLHNPGDQITLLHVLKPHCASMKLYNPVQPRQEFNKAMENEEFEKTKKIMEEYMKKCEELKLDCKTDIVKSDERSVPELLSSYTDKKGDMIVMGSGKHSTLHDLVLGGTTFGTIKKSKKPVMIIPTKN